MRKWGEDEAVTDHGTSEDVAQERIASELRRLGVADAICSELARRLEPLVRVLSPEVYGIVLAGVSLTHRLHREREATLARSVRGITELPRLLGTLAEELRKLDEALGVLTVQRKRPEAAVATPSVPPRRLLH